MLLDRQSCSPFSVKFVVGGRDRSGGGDQADLAHPFDSIGSVGLGRLDQDDIDRWHVPGAEDRQRSQGAVDRAALVVAREVFR